MPRTISRTWVVRTLIPALGDLVIFFAVLASFIALRSPIGFSPGTMLVFVPLAILFLAVFYGVGLYELRLVRDFVSLIGALLASAAVCGVLGTFYFYFLLPYLGQTPKTYLVLLIGGSHVLMLGWRRAILAATDFKLNRLRLLVLADGEHLEHLRLTQTLRSDAELDLAVELGPDVDLVVADSAWIEDHWERVKIVFAACVEKGIPIVSLERFYESTFGKVSPQYTSDPAWALEHILPRADGLYFKSRRLADLVLATLGLVLLAPFLALTALLIRIFDGLSPIYGQQRVGYLGRVFTLWKFRTMLPDSDAAAFSVSLGGQDARVTRLGRVLRRFRFDELPQMWNIVLGDMSFVGPRPEWIKEVEILEKLVPNYHLRHLVPPGITGWAQVYFRSTSDPQDSIEKHHFDLYYLKHFSPALDLSILLKTIKRVFINDSRISRAQTPFPRNLSRTPHVSVDISSIISRN